MIVYQKGFNHDVVIRVYKNKSYTKSLLMPIGEHDIPVRNEFEKIALNELLNSDELKSLRD